MNHHEVDVEKVDQVYISEGKQGIPVKCNHPDCAGALELLNGNGNRTKADG
jgi:hypothetical protein